MIISESKKFIYIHIYKTGGSTIADLLSPYVDEKFRGKDATKEGFGWQSSWHLKGQQHAKIADSLPILDSLEIDCSDYFVFTFVRNPYSWLLSVWNNFYRHPSANLPQGNVFQQLKNIYRKRFRASVAGAVHFYRLFPDGSFPSFILFLEQMAREKNKRVKQYWGAYDQYSFLENNRGLQIDFIGKLENFEEDVRQLLQKLDIDHPDKLPHRTYKDSEAERKNYLDYYDDRSLKIVNRLFQRDFTAFDYPQLESVLQEQ